MNHHTRDWEAHYVAGDTPWDHGEAAPGLVDFLAAQASSTRGRVLVPGCGIGHDAAAWAAAGLEVLGMDLAPTAMARASERWRAIPGLAFRHGDFLDSTPADGSYDWVFEHTLYCAIDPALRDQHARSVARWLRPGGHFLAVHYINPDTDQGPPFPCSRDEVLGRFGPYMELLSDWVPRSWEGRTGRERMFWWRRTMQGAPG
ncbi:MAG: methyltransferase domain-containing protein [Verrucomicrobiota bacterium]|jgi:SAM-dependent methyltransferase